MKSNMPPQKNFSKVPEIRGVQRSVFNRTHTHKSTFDTGKLVPFYVDEILPGDSQDVKANIFARLSSSLEFPIMDNLHMDTFFFFVPFRILWTNWKKFMGEREDPDSSIDFIIPQVTSVGVAVGDLFDFFGIPTGVGVSINSLYARGYIKIYNEWFRDQNLIDSVLEFSGDGPEVDTQYPIQSRGKRHDYFTSCLPFPQKTALGVGIALTGNIPVIGNGTALGFDDGSAGFGLYRDTGSAALDADSSLLGDPIGTAISSGSKPINEIAIGISDVAAESGLIGVLSSANSITINELRLAVATQQFLELDARGGTRYVELIKANFGVTSPDFRLQRPEYLGGSSNMMHVNPVTQTSESQPTHTPLGEQAAFGTGSSRSGYSKSFTEHGMVIGIINVRADLTYQLGLNRMFTRVARLDFYFPTFANLGEQAVLNSEIMHQDLAIDALVFGYNERWSEYRYKNSQISGRFRSNATDTLDAWHLSQKFTVLPTLGEAFITENLTEAMDRVLTVTGDDIPEIIFDSVIEVRHARPMPVYSVPGLSRL